MSSKGESPPSQRVPITVAIESGAVAIEPQVDKPKSRGINGVRERHCVRALMTRPSPGLRSTLSRRERDLGGGMASIILIESLLPPGEGARSADEGRLKRRI